MDILENYMSNYVEDIERSIWAKFFFPTMLHLDLHSPPVILAKQGRRKKNGYE